MDDDLHLELVLRRGAEPVAGWLVAAGGAPQAFRGYLELLAAIERAVTDPTARLGSAEAS